MNFLEKRSRKMNKKGQVTIFIIIGIAIVLIAGAFLLFRDKISISSRVGTTQIEPIKESFEKCLNDKLNQEIATIKRFGGKNELEFVSEPYNEYNVLNKPYNTLPPLNIIQDNINEMIRQAILNNECSLDDFRNDFDITEDENRLNSETVISESTVNIKVVYPIIVQKQDFKAEIEEFNIIINDDFGKMWRFAHDIVNGQIIGSKVNLAEYCLEDPKIICESLISTSDLGIVQIVNKDDLEGKGAFVFALIK